MLRLLHALTLLAATAHATGSALSLLRFDPDRYLEHVKFLSSDELGGRGNGTPGLERAADYIANEFRTAGLEPAGDTGTYFQSFEIPARLEPDPRSTLVISTASGPTSFVLGSHYHPLPAGDSPVGKPPRASDRLPLVFAGYGISAPGLGYDDYGDVDVTGKAVIVFTHEPQERDSRSVFDGEALTPYSDLAEKADQARRRGARLLILLEDPSHATDGATTPGWNHLPQTDPMRIPVVRVDRTRLAHALHGMDFAALARGIDETLSPRSHLIQSASVNYAASFAVVKPRVRNVVGILRGSEPSAKSDAIVIGAHYDHIGLDTRFSKLPGSDGQIHNGADDNASGTAAVVEMARLASANRVRFRAPLIFVTFAGEEIGLIGSKQYVGRPPLPIARTTLMINLDMIGRARGRVLVGGIDRSPRLKAILEDLRPFSTLKLDDFQEGYGDGASDDASFRRKGVPVIAFFTGFHDDYHRPSDDWPGIDAAGASEIATLALAVAEEMSMERARD